MNLNNTTEGLNYTLYNEYIVSAWIWHLFPPILIVLGTIGNVCTILVYSRKHLRRSNISQLFIVLAIADIASLNMCLFPRWLFKVSTIQPNDGSCKFLMFFTYFSVDMSVWTLVLITVFRAVYIWFRGKIQSCQQQKLRAIIIVIIVVLFSINAHVLHGVDEIDEEADDILLCFPNNPSYIDFYSTVWPWIDLCIFCVIPLTVLILGNVCIITKVVKSRSKVNANRASVADQNINRNRMSSVTRTIIILNAVFFVTTSPVSVYLIGLNYWDTEHPHEKAKHKLVWVLVLMLMFTNNAVNFVIYCLSGTVFRKELLAILRGKNSMTSSTTDMPIDTISR